MNRCRPVALVLAFAAMLSQAVLAQDTAPPPTAAQVFEKLKALAGNWQGTGSDGKMRTVSYQIVAGGTALQETLSPENEPSMVSIYHCDGDRIMMTHYCPANNQPRMQADIPTGDLNTLKFVFVDVTNLAQPTNGHIHGLTLAFADADHIAQTWTWRENGKEVSDTFKFRRKD